MRIFRLFHRVPLGAPQLKIDGRLRALGRRVADFVFEAERVCHSGMQARRSTSAYDLIKERQVGVLGRRCGEKATAVGQMRVGDCSTDGFERAALSWCRAFRLWDCAEPSGYGIKARRGRGVRVQDQGHSRQSITMRPSRLGMYAGCTFRSRGGLRGGSTQK
eukprot:1491037-Prymnesium_polylepis.2